VVARRAHNPKVVGSSPTPATERKTGLVSGFFYYFCRMNFHVYIIESQEGKRYTGQTSNLDQRLKEHNEGTTFTTKKSQNW
jgi:hypothetical protein